MPAPIRHGETADSPLKDAFPKIPPMAPKYPPNIPPLE